MARGAIDPLFARKFVLVDILVAIVAIGRGSQIAFGGSRIFGFPMLTIGRVTVSAFHFLVATMQLVIGVLVAKSFQPILGRKNIRVFTFMLFVTGMTFVFVFVITPLGLDALFDIGVAVHTLHILSVTAQAIFVTRDTTLQCVPFLMAL
jgi:hypothetical protein